MRHLQIAAMAAIIALGALGGAASAHSGHPQNPLARTVSVQIASAGDIRVDLVVAFEIDNPTDRAFEVVGVEAAGGVDAALLSGDGSASGASLTVPVGPQSVVQVAPPFGVLVLKGALRRALEGVGTLITLRLADGDELKMLVRSAPA